MSSYATVYLGDGRPICAFRNGVDQLFFILFTQAEWIELDGSEAWKLVKHQYGADESVAHVVGFRSTVGALRDRLDLLGVPLSAVASELVGLASEHAEMLVGLEGRLGHDEEVGAALRVEIDYLTSLSWDSWLAQLRAGVAAGLPVTGGGQPDVVGTPSQLMFL